MEVVGQRGLYTVLPGGYGNPRDGTYTYEAQFYTYTHGYGEAPII